MELDQNESALTLQSQLKQVTEQNDNLKFKVKKQAVVLDQLLSERSPRADGNPTTDANKGQNPFDIKIETKDLQRGDYPENQMDKQAHAGPPQDIFKCH